jgi:glycosyltransferase involved in cell wall biosynthesis
MLAGIRVLMLIRRSDEFDIRARKEAASLAAVGFHVRVLALARDGVPETEVIGEVEYERIRHQAWMLAGVRDRYIRTQAARKERYLARSAAIRRRRQAHVDAHVRRAATITSRLSAVDASHPRARRVVLRLGLSLSRLTRRRLLALDRRRLLMARRRMLSGHHLLRRGWVGYQHAHKRLLLLRYHPDYWRSVRPAMERFEPHIVQANDESTLYAARRYARRHRVPLLYDARELELHRNTVWTWPKRIMVWIVELLGARAAAAVITVGPEIADALASAYRIERPAVILNSPSLETRHARPGFSLRAAAGLGDSESLVVYVGAVARGRGLEQLVDALEHMPGGCHVGVLGPRTAQHDADLVERAARLGVANRFHLLAPLPPASVPPALREASVCVIPVQNICRSYDLALPNKLFDAVMAGVPIAVADLVAMRTFVSRHGLGEHFDETDPRSIARTVCHLLEDQPPGLRDPAALDAVQRSICWEEQERILWSIYERITQSIVGEGRITQGPHR